MKHKKWYFQWMIFVLILLIYNQSITVLATNNPIYKQISDQIIISSENMSGKEGWYVCVTNCEYWGLKEGEWHQHLKPFEKKGHKPIYPVQSYDANRKLKVDAVDPKDFYQKGFDKGYIDGYNSAPYEDTSTEKEEAVINSYQQGYKDGYEKGKLALEKENELSEEELFTLGKKIGYEAYQFGATKNHLAHGKEERSLSL